MPRKPPSVWIGQILIALAWLVFTASFVYYAALTWPAIIKAIAPHPWALAWFIARISVTLVLIGFVAWIIALVSRRSPLGRWLGLLCLALLLAVAIYASFNPSPTSWQPTSDAEKGGYFIGQILSLLLYLLLIWRFGFSKAARAYFTRRQAA